MFNEQEKIEIQKFVGNEVMVQAIKKVLLFPIYGEGVLVAGQAVGDPAMNFALSKCLQSIQVDPKITDEMLGQNLRADTQGLRYIELGFKELEKFKTVAPVKKDDTNKAR